MVASAPLSLLRFLHFWGTFLDRLHPCLGCTAPQLCYSGGQRAVLNTHPRLSGLIWRSSCSPSERHKQPHQHPRGLRKTSPTTQPSLSTPSHPSLCLHPPVPASFTPPKRAQLNPTRRRALGTALPQRLRFNPQLPAQRGAAAPLPAAPQGPPASSHCKKPQQQPNLEPVPLSCKYSAVTEHPSSLQPSRAGSTASHTALPPEHLTGRRQGEVGPRGIKIIFNSPVGLTCSDQANFPVG